MQRSEAGPANDLVVAVERLGQALGLPDVVARGVQVAGVQADPQARVPARCLEQRGQLLERATQRASGPGRVLQVKITAFGLPQSLPDYLAGPADGLRDVSLLGRAGVEHH